VLAAQDHFFTPPAPIRSGTPVNIAWKLANPPQRLTLEVLDSAGAVLRTIESAPAGPPAGAGGGGGRRGGGGAFVPRAAGLTRFSWDLRTTPIVGFPGMILWGAGTAGPRVPSGTYTLRLTADGRTMTAPITVKKNPFLPDVSDADLMAQYRFGRMVRDKATEANTAVIEIRRVKSQLDDRLTRSSDAALKSSGETLRSNSSAVEENVYQVRNQSGQDPLNFPIKVNNRLATLLSMAERGDGRPVSGMPDIYRILETELKGYTDRLKEVWAKDLLAVNKELARLNLPLLDPKCAEVRGCAPTP
jgi:hypothetical protein